MKIIRTFADLQKYKDSSVATIGNFDGVHLGHQHILKTINQQAKKTNLKSVVVCFEPYPLEFINPTKAPARLSTISDKIKIFKKFNIDILLVLKFNQILMNLSPIDFIETIIQNGLQTKFLFIGDDFHFGKNRVGNYETLQKKSKIYGFDVKKSSTIEYKDQRISSTRVRDALSNDDFGLIYDLLGTQYCISGKVCHGKKLGATLGYPTANISIKQKKQPLFGVYVVNIVDDKNKTYQGVANIGTRPTIGGTKTYLETYIFDFKKNIYGKNLKICFLKKVRDEKKFNNIAGLTEQITKDVRFAKKYLKI
ncbi:MAG: bifunctional riboflavin kinase/FAD synthetase [Gammaproteobacteria bacterium]|nr:MAG: bifunctional riboflavin kinase/FAD synthetase [Gammaproteobacteria bacterium]